MSPMTADQLRAAIMEKLEDKREEFKMQGWTENRAGGTDDPPGYGRLPAAEDPREPI